MLLGIDIGTTHSKVGFYAHNGTVLGQGKVLNPKAHVAGFEHYLAEELWQGLARLIKDTLEPIKQKVDDLAISSMGESGLFLDSSGKILYPMIPWNDFRAHAQCEALVTKLAAENWFKITGLHPNPIHSIFKWVWLKEQFPEVWRHAHVWLSSAGFIRYKLSGAEHMEISQATRTMAYDVAQDCWSKEILNLANLDDHCLPELVSGSDCVGRLSPEAARLTGLVAGTPIYAGGHDHVCASLACGIISAEIGLDSMGTAEGLTFGLAGSPKPSAFKGFGVGPHVVKHHSYLMGGLYSSGGTIAWFKELFELDSYETLLNLIEPVPAGEAPFFVPHFFGAAPPFNQPDAKAAFLAVEPKHHKAHFARAVYEGIVFELRRHIEAFETLSGSPLKLLRVVGSSSHNQLWMQLRSAILGKRLELSQNPDMVTLGAALLAGIGAGIYQDAQDAILSSYQKGEVFEPDPDLQIRYEPLYQTYKRLVTALSN